MLNLGKIHKPATIQEALEQLQQPGTFALAGGTELIARARHDVIAAVDLSALGLAYIRENQETIAIGATTLLADLVESPILRASARGVLSEAARRSAASILRNQGTAAGTLISEPNGLLALALVALDGRVTIVRKETRMVPLADFLSMREHLLNMALLTEIAIPMVNPRAALQTVARTPSDKPIVGVCAAAQIENGLARNVRIALGGVGETVLRARAAEAALEGQTLNDSIVENAAAKAAEGLAPKADFRGSADYRREMAVVLTRRAVGELTHA